MIISNNYYGYQGTRGHVRRRITQFELVSRYDVQVDVDTNTKTYPST